MIKNLRRLQLSRFSSPPTRTKSEGLRIATYADSYNPPPTEVTSMHTLERRLSYSFFSMLKADAQTPSVGEILGAAYEDFFDLDMVCWLVYRNQLNEPIKLILIDPTMVRFILPERSGDVNSGFDGDGGIRTMSSFGEEGADSWEAIDFKFLESGEGAKFKDSFRYLLTMNDRPWVAVTPRMLIFSQFFRTTDMSRGLSSEPIMAQAMRIVEAATNTLSFNIDNFLKNRLPKGILVSTGDHQLSAMDMDVIVRTTWQMMAGPETAYKLPFISMMKDASLSWLNLAQNPREMEYYNWWSLLVTIICQLSGTDPGEIAMASNKQMMGPDSMWAEGAEGDVMKSQDSGLYTFLDAQANTINSAGIIKELAGGRDWYLKFEGMLVENEVKRTQMLVQQQDWISKNEIRARQDLPPIQEMASFDRVKLIKWGIDPDFFYALADTPGRFDLGAYLEKNAKLPVSGAYPNELAAMARAAEEGDLIRQQQGDNAISGALGIGVKEKPVGGVGVQGNGVVGQGVAVEKPSVTSGAGRTGGLTGAEKVENLGTAETLEKPELELGMPLGARNLTRPKPGGTTINVNEIEKKKG